MTQNSQAPKTKSQQLNRPGQRQQERIDRQQRRQRRRTIINLLIAAIVLIVIIGAGFVFYQQHSNSTSQSASNTGTTTASTSTPAAGSTPTTASSTPSSSAPATPPPTNIAPVTLPDGLKYIDISTGNGPAVKSGNTVAVQYTGWLQSTQQKFDSSYDHGGQPFTLTVGQHQVIPGWEEGLVGMKVGGTRRLIIPPALGYGSTAQGPIPANSTLIFDVTLASMH